MEPTIRNFKKDDGHVIARLMQEAYNSNPGYVTAHSFDEIVEFQKKNTHFFTAETDGKVVGYIQTYDGRSGYDSKWFKWLVGHLKNKNFLYLEQTIVDKEYRKKGIARSLVEKAIRAAKDDGYDIICATVLKKPLNKAAMQLATSLNFSEFEEFRTDGKVYSMMVQGG